MHDKRNFVVVLLLVGAVVWSVVSWLVLGEGAPLLGPQRGAALVLLAGSAAFLVYAFVLEDRMPDRLRAVVGDVYYEVDGVSFMPIVRVKGRQAELCLYYQNRFDSPAQIVVHLRPPEDCFVIRPGLRDVHFAFSADGGAFGVIRQPIAVPDRLQGEVLDVQLAAASYYPRGHGSRLRRGGGIPCGSLLVDWGGAAFKAGVHEVSGEIELRSPATLHLSMPVDVRREPSGSEVWRQELLMAGVG